MFNKEELQYLFSCVESASSMNTQTARNKAVMMLKLCDLLDAEEKKGIEVKPAKKVPVKKTRQKKA